MKRKTISLIVMAAITAVSLLACSFVYTKRLRDRNEMLAQAELSFVNSHQLGFAGNSYQPSRYDVTGEELRVTGDLGERYYAPVTEREQMIPEVPSGTQVKEINLSREGEQIYKGNAEGYADLFVENGTYDLEFLCETAGNATASDGTELKLAGTLTYAFRVNVDIPSGFRLSRTEMVQGSAVAVIGTNITGEVSATAPGVIDVINFTVDEKGNALALLSSTFRCSPGTYECVVTWNGEETVLPFTVTEGTYEVQHLTISTSTAAATVGNNDAMADYNGMIADTNLIWTPARYYEDSFIMPVNGPITTEFGLYRYTNGSSNPSRHVGLDIAEDEGTPVLAAASGKVVVSRWVGTTGYTVCIDHGYGVRSYYYHMSALTAGLGDFVEQGQEIGKVGQTGYANGPHVHFNIMVGDNSINPWPVFDGTSGIFDLPREKEAENG